MPHECTNCGRVFDDGSKEMLSGCPNCGGNKFQFRPSTSTDPDESASADPDPRSNQKPQSDRKPRSDQNPQSDRKPRSEPDLDGPAGSDQSPSTPDSAPRTDANTPPTTPRDGDKSDRPRLSRSSKSWPGQDEDSQPADRSPEPTPESRPDPDAERTDAETDTDGTALSADDSAEDTAQASARSDVVSPDELAAASRTSSTTDEPADASPSPNESDGRVIEPSSDERPDLDDLRAELNQQFESIRIVAPGEYELNLMELYDRTEYIISLQEDGRYVIEVPDTWDTTPDSSSDS
ncbi:OapC/ArvC family zinc-ribbon domain-containing protein [Halobellus salinisoli]|uniref:OapC/ArvC family zinc-ribbon domain-containing protein n=1 Tax=Halobellus salinisoli TaxID=3108500 RepID=UPI003008AAEF